MHPAANTLPATPADGVVEFRQYQLHPGRRDALVSLFDRAFVESQEAVGMRVIGQFRDLADPDRFTWLRGFADMAARRRGLEAFYGGPVWAAHQAEANATMADSDNVLLLRPAWPGSGVPAAGRPARDMTAAARGLVDATIFYLREPASAGVLEIARDPATRALRRGGASSTAWYVTEAAANDFPRLPVRAGEQVLLGLAVFPDAAGFDAFSAGGAWNREVAPLLQPHLSRAPETHRLQPTARSALRA